MSNAALQTALQTMTPDRQRAYLAEKGFPAEKIGDYLNWLTLSRISEPEPGRAVKGVPNNTLRAKIEAKQAEIEQRKAAEIERKQKLTPEELLAEETRALEVRQNLLVSQEADQKTGLFQDDVDKNRKMFGGNTIYDTASLHNPEIKRSQVVDWYQEAFTHSGCRFALVLGSVGSGKTWGTIAYANSVSDSPAFVPAYRLSEMVANQRKFQNDLDALTRRKTLIIDDLGCEPPGFRGSDFLAFFDYLVDERYKRCFMTFITSNLTSAAFKEIYGSRIVSRFNEIGMFKETTDPDFRSKQR